MKKSTLILSIMLTAGIATADFYDTKTEAWHNNRKTLPDRIGQTMGVKRASPAKLKELGIISAIVDQIPAGMVASGGYTVEVIEGVAHKVLSIITTSEHEAAEASRKAAEEAVAIAEHNAEAPEGLLSKWSKREICLLNICKRLAMYQGFTEAQFEGVGREEWNTLKEEVQ